MERAGLAVVSKINELFFQNTGHKIQRKVIVLAGSGNNGGDGLVVARILHNQGKEVEVFLSAKPEDLKGDARINYEVAKKFGVRIYPIKKFLSHCASRITRHCVIVDALLGTGLSKEVRAPLSDAIEKVNKMSSPVVSIDIPSGISSDTGQIMGCAVKAQYTVSFGLPKRGHLLYPGAEYTGRLYIEDIGFPEKLLKSDKIKVNLMQREDALSLLPQRPKYSHKGTYGHVLLVAGSRGKTGAAFMAARACLRAGVGLVTIGIPDSLTNTFQSRVTEEMILPLPDKGNGTLSYKAIEPILEFLNQKANALAIGPGISMDDEISKLVSLLITESKVPMVIDADGINAIAGRSNILRKSKAPIILTPHPGEMARLLNSHKSQVTSKEVEKDRINTALSFSRKTETYLVLKGAPTVIATSDGKAFINSTGNPGMATAGTGDVLTGMISAFLAQGLTPQNASILGVYMHGLIGDIVAEKKGKHSLIASDIINTIPAVFKALRS
jgi:NAD(P)H-hydrate epimerase